MFNSRKIRYVFLVAILFLIILSSTSLAIVSPTKDFFVNDYAGVLTEETKDYIMKTNIELQQKTGAQIVVVTVSSLDGQSVEEYATELFRKFGIGDSKKNNGILLLCSTGERRLRIEVGYGLEGAITDGKAGMIRDEYITPYLRNNNYNQGIKNGFSAILQEVTNEYNITISNIEIENTTNESYQFSNIEIENTTNESYKYSFEFYMLAFFNVFIILCICIARFEKLSIKINKFKIKYMCILAILGGLSTKSIIETILLLVISVVSYLAIYFIIIINSGGDYNDFGGSSGGGSTGGFSGGGGSSGGGGASGSF